MQCEDKVETEHSLAKVHKVCRLIGIIVKIIFCSLLCLLAFNRSINDLFAN